MTSETTAYPLLPPSSPLPSSSTSHSLLPALHMYVLHLTASAWLPNYTVERPCSRAACDFPEEALQVTHMARLFPYMVPLLHIPTSLSSIHTLLKKTLWPSCHNSWFFTSFLWSCTLVGKYSFNSKLRLITFFSRPMIKMNSKSNVKYNAWPKYKVFKKCTFKGKISIEKWKQFVVNTYLNC